MHEVRCGQCGRRFALGDEAEIGVCPSCGQPVARPASADAVALAAPTDPVTRPISLEAGTISAASAAPLEAQTLMDPAATRESFPPASFTPLTRPSSASPETLPPIPAAPTAPGQHTADLPRVRAAEGPGGGSAPGGAGGTPGKRGWLNRASIVVLVVLLLLGSATVILAGNGQLARWLGSSSATATPTPTHLASAPSPPPGFVAYRDPGGVFTLWAPMDWQPTTQVGNAYSLVLFANSTGDSTFQFVTYVVTGDPQQYDDQTISAERSALNQKLTGGKGSTSLSGQQGPQTVPLAGATWTQESVDITATGGGQARATTHLVVLATSHGRDVLAIAYYAPSASFASTNVADFSVMLSSLSLLPSQA